MKVETYPSLRGRSRWGGWSGLVRGVSLDLSLAADEFWDIG